MTCGKIPKGTGQGFMRSTIFGAVPTPALILKIGAGSLHTPCFQKGATPATTPLK